MMGPTPPPWEWKSDGLYSDDFPIVWVTQAADGELHVGVHADDEHVVANASAMYAALIPFARKYELIKRTGRKPAEIMVPFEWLECADDVLMKIRLDEIKD